MHFQLTTSVTRKWVKKGSKPRVASMSCRKNVAYSGFINPKTGELLVNKPGRFNYETTIQSLRDFISVFDFEKNKKVYVVIDNAPWHQKAFRLIQEECVEEYQDIRDKIILLKLPPYSPDLNPIEQCWRITRRAVTHNVFFPDVNSLSNALDNFFNLFKMPNAKFASLCSFKYGY